MRGVGLGFWMGNNQLYSFPRCPSTLKWGDQRFHSQEAGRSLGPEPMSLQGLRKELLPHSQEGCVIYLLTSLPQIQPNEVQTPAGPRLEGLYQVSTNPFAAGL